MNCFLKVNRPKFFQIMVGLYCITSAIWLGVASGDETEKSYAELSKMSLEDIFDIEVTSVSRRSQSLSSTAAAVHVVTQEDIRRTGARTIPEALRMVPGVQVAQINNHSWAVTIRGLNDLFSNKLLVLIDGRTVYTPIFSGVYWDALGHAMEDIERIEVIRGPGATMWGSNAVNGVINIITRNAADMQGGKLSVAAGNVETGRATVSYGDSTESNRGQYRMFASGFQHTDTELDGREVADEWNQGQIGFRGDYSLTDHDTVSTSFGVVRSDASINRVKGDFVQPLFRVEKADEEVTDSHVLARWRREVSDDESWNFQAYYNQMQRSSAYAGDILVQTADLDFQHDFELTPHSRIIYGLGWRVTMDEFDDQVPGETAVFLDDERTTNLVSGFVQSELAFLEDKARIIFGSKIEHNYYTNVEVQPNVRVIGEISDATTLWGSVARAVRVPSRRDDNLNVSTPLVLAGDDPRLPVKAPFPVQIAPQIRDGIDSEELFAYEIGLRTKVTEKFSVDVATFFNRYDSIVDPSASTPVFSPTPSPHLEVPVGLSNGGRGDSWGGEVSAQGALFDEKVRLFGSYSYITVDSALEDIANIRFPGVPLKQDHPRHQATARAYIDAFEDVDFTLEGYYVDALQARNVGSYIRFDASVGWDVQSNIRLAFHGANLLEGDHREFGPINVFGIEAGEIGRSFFSTIEVKFD